MENYSTSLAVTDMYNEFLGNLDNNHYTWYIFLNLVKAFDSVDHELLLLKKLEKYGR